MGTLITTMTTRRPMSKYYAQRLLACFIGLSSSACSVVPGLNLQVTQSNVGSPTELGGFDYIQLNSGAIADNYTSPDALQHRLLGVHNALSLPEVFLDTARDRYEYRIGPGDILSIIVWGHPELTSPAGEFRDAESAGRLVAPDGAIFYPYVGRLEVSGRTANQVRALIASGLAKVVREPQVDVRVVSFRSQFAHVAGEVVRERKIPLTDVPVTVADALEAAGGYKEGAVTGYLFLHRNGNKYLVEGANMRNSGVGLGAQSIPLKSGDIVEVVSSRLSSVYLVGALNSQTTVPLPEGKMSVIAALSEADGLNMGQSDASAIYVVRAGNDQSREGSNGRNLPPRAKVFCLRMKAIDSLILAERFNVIPGDVIYVDRTGLASYNQVISQVLPTVSTLFQLDRLINNN